LSRTIETLDGRVLLTRSRTDLIEKILHRVESGNSDEKKVDDREQSKEIRPLHRIKSEKLKNVHQMAKLSLSNYKNSLSSGTIESI
jgi:hypothetical protein